MKKYFILCPALIMLAAFAANAQTDSKAPSQNSSLDETIGWLREKLTKNAAYKGYDTKAERAGKRMIGHSILVTHLISEVVFDGCLLKYRYDASQSPGTAHIFNNAIALGDIDPAKIKVEGDEAPHFVKLFTIQGEPKIKQEERVGDSGSPARTSLGVKNVAEAALPFYEREIAEQAAAAFSHAATLCKAKKERP